jgi:hypothetical protein
MKTNFTFEELSKIFAAITKIEDAANKQQEAEQAYEEKGRIFDAEFAKCGYTFFKAPKELQVMFDEKCALMDAREKAERKAYKAIKDFAALMEIGNGCREWEEDDVKEYIGKKWYFNTAKVVERCKYLAIVAARKITY